MIITEVKYSPLTINNYEYLGSCISIIHHLDQNFESSQSKVSVMKIRHVSL